MTMLIEERDIDLETAATQKVNTYTQRQRASDWGHREMWKEGKNMSPADHVLCCQQANKTKTIHRP